MHGTDASRPAGVRNGWLLPCCAALALTLLGAWKPMVIDETIYARYAAQIAAHPGDPYGFDVLWYEAPQPAHEIVVPPLLPYWLAGARRTLGDSPVLWKLSLLPFALAFTGALASLLRRLAPPLAVPVLAMIVLSPGVLTSFNLMLSIPTLGLSLLAVITFLAACDHGRVSLAGLSGLLAGLAMQTKYTGVLGLGAIALHAALFRRLGLGAVAGAVATALFAGWEVFTTLQYGESHFLHGVRLVREHYSGNPVSMWSAGFVSLVGATLPAVGVLAVTALGGSGRAALGAALAVAAAFAAIPLIPAGDVAGYGRAIPEIDNLQAEVLIFVPLGLAVLVAIAALARDQVRYRLAHRDEREGSEVTASPRCDAWRWDAWLLGWLALELAGFFLLSPYLAARRLIGFGLVVTLLAARVGVRAGPRAAARARTAVALSAALGLVYLVADYSDASARRRVVDDLVRYAWNSGTPRCRRMFFTGHWGFQYYALDRGLLPCVAGRTALQSGDCLVIPRGVDRQKVYPDPERTRLVAKLIEGSGWPWTTIPAFYLGPTPIRSQPDAQVRALVYRVLADHVPAADRDSATGSAADPEP